ncbi:hypothetical protein D9C73_015619 [Collichthys lucidus]|uniref:Uncharacterized protein n=1 Tax=Collichthys lucidus TaxID=240159 RepID=A0A4U5V1D1_COLLU|nr:hypothetical protein D9C73_015619 [Collichthys lucidus]
MFLLMSTKSQKSVKDRDCREAYASEDGLSITPGGPPESGASLYSTTQDTGRKLPVVTTPSPVNVPNHHPLYSNLPQHRPLFGPHSQPNYFEDSGGSSSHPSSQSTFSTSPIGTPLGNGDKRASDESTESSNMQTTLVMHTLAATSHPETPGPVSSGVLKDLERDAIIPSAVPAAREEDEGRPDQPGLKQDVRPASDEEETTTTTTTITTTTIITTMQSPIPCQLNMTGPEGYIEASTTVQLCFSLHYGLQLHHHCLYGLWSGGPGLAHLLHGLSILWSFAVLYVLTGA